jgi:hypothetical protein
MAVNVADECLMSYDVEEVVEPCQPFLNGRGIHAIDAGPVVQIQERLPEVLFQQLPGMICDLVHEMTTSCLWIG